MAQNLSLAELSKLYSNAKKAPAALSAGGSLTGATPKDKLSKLFFTRESSSLFAVPSALAMAKTPTSASSSASSSASASASASASRTIAICLVIVDSLHHEEIWRHWVEQGDAPEAAYKANLYIHAKHPEKLTSAWARQHCLPVSYMPEWNSPEVVRAMLATLDAALEDPHRTCERIVFGTESCLPLHSLHDSGSLLFSDDKSWLDAFHQGKSNWERASCFAAVDDKVVPPKAVWKSIPGWIMLTRRHAAEVSILTKQSLYLDWRGEKGGQGPENSNANAVKHSVYSPLRGAVPSVPQEGLLGSSPQADLVSAWGTPGTWTETKAGVWAPEEVFFATVMSLLGYLRQTKDEVRRQMVTYARWKKKGDANPISFDDFTVDLCKEFRESGAVFGRKFSKGTVSLAKWQAVVMAVDSKGGVKSADSSKKPVVASSASTNTYTTNKSSTAIPRKISGVKRPRAVEEGEEGEC